MPSKRRSSTSTHPTKAARTQTSANEIHGQQRLLAPLRPPLEPGQESVMDVAREIVKRKYPNFLPRNSVDIISMAGPGYDGPATQESICAHIDARTVLHIAGQQIPNVEDSAAAQSEDIDTTIGRIPATDIIGVRVFCCLALCSSANERCQFCIVAAPSARTKGLGARHATVARILYPPLGIQSRPAPFWHGFP